MIRCGVLYYRKAKPCSAYILGMTLVHSEKALENAVLLVLRYTYSVIRYDQHGVGTVVIGAEPDLSATLVILYSVIAQVEQYFRKQAELSANINIFAFYINV